MAFTSAVPLARNSLIRSRSTCLINFSPRAQDAPAVIPVAAPAHGAMDLQPVDQFHGAVMLQRQPVRQRTNRRFLALREPAQRQQEQVLLRLETRSTRRRVPFANEFANEVAQLRQSAVLGRCNFARHVLSIS